MDDKSSDRKRTVVAAMVRQGSEEAAAFDRRFWEEAGHEVRFAASWDMVQDLALFQGKKNAGESRLQRSVCSLQPRGS
jgi:hypothetical protein